MKTHWYQKLSFIFILWLLPLCVSFAMSLDNSSFTLQNTAPQSNTSNKANFNLQNTATNNSSISNLGNTPASDPHTYTTLTQTPELERNINTQTSIPYLINSIISLVIAVAAGLAVIMIVWGGIERMTKDSIQKATDGRKRIENAIYGLLIALSAYLLLKTINPKLLNLDFAVNTVTIQPVDANLTIANSLDTSNAFQTSNSTSNSDGNTSGNGNTDTNSSAVLDGLKNDGETASQAILRNALYAADPSHPLDTCSAPGTGGGTHACAYAVNEIVQSALGQPITGSLGTPEMYNALKSSSNFEFVGGLSAAQPGDIVISPTNDSKTGHVGIVKDSSRIISNSSSQRKVLDNFSYDSWNNSFGSTNGVYVFRAKN